MTGPFGNVKQGALLLRGKKKMREGKTWRERKKEEEEKRREGGEKKGNK